MLFSLRARQTCRAIKKNSQLRKVVERTMGKKGVPTKVCNNGQRSLLCYPVFGYKRRKRETERERERERERD